MPDENKKPLRNERENPLPNEQKEVYGMKRKGF